MASLGDHLNEKNKGGIWGLYGGKGKNTEPAPAKAEPTKVKAAEKSDAKTKKTVKKVVRTKTEAKPAPAKATEGNTRVIVISSYKTNNPQLDEKLPHVNTQKVIKADQSTVLAAGVVGAGLITLLGLVLRNSK